MSYPFYSLSLFPGLEELKKHWELIRDEALEHLDSFYPMKDDRNITGNWSYMPLKPEPDDQQILGEALMEKVRKHEDKFPQTRRLCESVNNEGYVFSLLGPRGHIGAHSHELEFVSAILGLKLREPCVFRVGSQNTRIREGEFTIFDYRVEHEAWNPSDEDRLVLLISLRIQR